MAGTAAVSREGSLRLIGGKRSPRASFFILQKNYIFYIIYLAVDDR